MLKFLTLFLFDYFIWTFIVTKNKKVTNKFINFTYSKVCKILKYVPNTHTTSAVVRFIIILIINLNLSFVHQNEINKGLDLLAKALWIFIRSQRLFPQKSESFN